MLLLHPPIEPWLQRAPEGCRIALLADRDDFTKVYLRAQPDNEELQIEMRAVGRSGSLARYEAVLPWDRSNVATTYAFKVVHDGTQTWLAADGMHAHPPREAELFRVHTDRVPPDWVREQVFYEIFPDRFFRGNEPRDRRGETVYGAAPFPVVQLDWNAISDPRQASHTFYGGDLDGITQKLDYLQGELGVTALYLTPVFTSGSNHKYDTQDFDHVDPHFGGNAALARLCHAMHARGLKIVLDAVVNHTGTNHPWFNQWNQHPILGAFQSPDSPWRGWYAFEDDGTPRYWKGHKSLPVLDFSHPGVRSIVYQSHNAILRRWLRPPYAIDGWRFDVIHMLGEGGRPRNNAHYVREFRRAVKEENPNAYLLGEHFSEATRWLQGDQEDGAMNYYGFTRPVQAWLAGVDVVLDPTRLDTAQFEAWLARARSAIPFDIQLTQFNLLDSHDTPRFLTLAGNDLARTKLAATLLLAYPGVPCIYYGDEIGTEGGADPDCRRCFDWDRSRWKIDLFEHYRALITLRKQRREWRDGAYQTLALGEDWLAFARYTESEATIVILNRGAAVEVAIPVWRLPLPLARWRQVAGSTIEPAGGEVTLSVPAAEAVILLAET